MRVLRFMGYPINNFSTLERAVARQSNTIRALGGREVTAFDGVARAEAAAAFQEAAGADAFVADLPNLVKRSDAATRIAYAAAAHRLIQRERPDIVHVYFGPSSEVLNELALLHPRTRFVRTIGSTPIPTQRGARFPLLRQLKWRFGLRSMKAVICVAPHIKSMLAGFGVDAGRLHVVPNPTDLAKFAPRSQWQVGDQLALAFLGRLDPIKNLETLIRGVALALRAPYSVPARLSIYGAGPQQEALAGLIRELGVQEQIVLAGRVDDVPAALAKADVYVQASHHEGCPAAVGEAMAAGIPVVLSDIPGHRQMIEEGVQGVFFDGASPQALASALQGLWTKKAQIPALGAAARERATGCFSMERWVDGELAIYRALLGGRPGRIEQVASDV
jgi:glycosyltransferase involved in cell wall biosynthesis